MTRITTPGELTARVQDVGAARLVAANLAVVGRLAVTHQAR